MSGRNTTIIRSNYLLPGNIPFYELSMKLWEGLEQDLNYNAMVSQRGVLNLYHSDAQRDAYARRGNAMRLHGVDAELLDARRRARASLPFLDFDNARFPIQGGLLQRRGGTARHDAVVWGYARAASERGVDIIQNCEVTGFRIERRPGRRRRDDARVHQSASKVGIGGRRQHLARRRAGGLAAADRKPCAAGLRVGGHQAVHRPAWSPSAPGISTSASRTRAASCSAATSTATTPTPSAAICPRSRTSARSGMALMPMLGRLRVLRSWGGVMDMSMDGSPIIDRTPIDGLYLNAGWCYGGFKATPASGWCFAHLIARDEPHPVARAYRLDRFATGRLIDESGAGAQPNLH